MKIKKIHIYGYGKWQEKVWEVPSQGMHVFFGMNESGKSTLMSFIRSILFGFPKKGDNQFIPLDSNAYGGKLILETTDNNELTIERVKGRKAKGDVTIYYSDGRSDGEEGLAEFLSGIDLQTYLGIFHFDLDGLNGIAHMDPTELNQFLYDTGLGGGQSITSIEKKIALNMEQLFKPRGKKTELNALTVQLEKKEKDIFQWNKRIDQYEASLEEIRLIELVFKENKSELNDISNRIKHLEKLEMLLPLAKQWEERRLLLNEQKQFKFPENGLIRLETLTDKLMDKQTAKREEQHKLQTLQLEIQSLNIHEQWPVIKNEIVHCVQDYEYIRKENEKLKQFRIEVQELEVNKTRLDEQWFNDSTFSFSRIPHHAHVKNKFLHLKKQWDLEEGRLLRLTEEKTRIEKDLTFVEKEVELVEGTLLDIAERQQMEDALEEMKEIKYVDIQRNMLQERLDIGTTQTNGAIKREKKQQTVFLTLAFAFFITVIIFSILAMKPTALLMFGMSAIFFLLSLWKKKAVAQLRDELSKQKQEITGKLEEIEKRHSEINRNQLLEWKEKLEIDQKNRQRFDASKFELKALQNKFSSIGEEWKDCLNQFEILQVEKNQWCVENHLPLDGDISFYEEILVSLEQWKDFNEKAEVIMKNIRSIEQSNEHFDNRVEGLLGRIHLAYNVDQTLTSKIELLKQFIEMQEQTSTERQKLLDLQKLRRENLNRIFLEIEELESQRMSLFESAQVKDEENFRKKALEYEKYDKYTNEKEQLLVQMKLLIPKEEELEYNVNELLYNDLDPIIELKDLQFRFSHLTQANEDKINRLSQIKNEVSLLERDGTYEELLQDYAQMKEELSTLAKNWAALALSKQIITEVKNIYEQEKQPAVIKEAEKLFGMMTEGKYVKLLAPLGEERFILERADGIRFEPSQVSRGTCELLYLSLRFALAGLFIKSTHFPILMDETLVNIDRGRRRNVIYAMKEIAKNRQILFFTCHDHMVEELEGNFIEL